MHATKTSLLRRTIAVTAGALLALTAACSAGGTPQKNEDQGGGQAADTPRKTVAMITHQPPGDAFWDIVQSGAKAAAAKDNIQLEYSADPDPGQQATLLQTAIDKKVDGIVVTLAKPDAMKAGVQTAVKAGIPVVVVNSGVAQAKEFGALMAIGQDETLAGEQAGERLAKAGAKHVICVAPEQGNVSVEARCDGAAKTMTSGRVEKLYVNGADPAAMTSAIQAKVATDKDIDYFLSQGGAAILSTVEALGHGDSHAKITGFDLNPDVAKRIKDGTVEWTIDQQPYLQGYYAVDNLWLYFTNGNVGGGGKPILTGPAFVDVSNIDAVLQYAANGTR